MAWLLLAEADWLALFWVWLRALKKLGLGGIGKDSTSESGKAAGSKKWEKKQTVVVNDD